MPPQMNSTFQFVTSVSNDGFHISTIYFMFCFCFKLVTRDRIKGTYSQIDMECDQCQVHSTSIQQNWRHDGEPSESHHRIGGLRGCLQLPANLPDHYGGLCIVNIKFGRCKSGRLLNHLQSSLHSVLPASDQRAISGRLDDGSPSIQLSAMCLLQD